MCISDVFLWRAFFALGVFRSWLGKICYWNGHGIGVLARCPDENARKSQ